MRTRANATVLTAVYTLLKLRVSLGPRDKRNLKEVTGKGERFP